MYIIGDGKADLLFRKTINAVKANAGGIYLKEKENQIIFAKQNSEGTT